MNGWRKLALASAFSVAMAAGAAPASATVVLTQVPDALFSGGVFDLFPYLFDSSGRTFAITSGTLSVHAHSDPHYGAPTTTSVDTVTGSSFTVDPVSVTADISRVVTRTYVDGTADSLTLTNGIFGGTQSVVGTVSETLNTTETSDGGVTDEGPPFPGLSISFHVTTTNVDIHQAIYGPLDLVLDFNAASLHDVNAFATVFYQLTPGGGSPFGIPDFPFGGPPQSHFVYDSATFAFDRTQTGGPPLPPPSVGVPEPAAWALMLTGFGLAGAGLRRRRSLAAGV